jgi:hypothetical protein
MKCSAVIPLEVYRCLVKLGMALLPRQELGHFESARLWLLEMMPPSHPALASLAMCHIAFCPVPFPEPWACLWRRRVDHSPFPYILGTVASANAILMFPLPPSKQTCRIDLTSPDHTRRRDFENRPVFLGIVRA